MILKLKYCTKHSKRRKLSINTNIYEYYIYTIIYNKHVCACVYHNLTLSSLLVSFIIISMLNRQFLNENVHIYEKWIPVRLYQIPIIFIILKLKNTFSYYFSENILKYMGFWGVVTSSVHLKWRQCSKNDTMNEKIKGLVFTKLLKRHHLVGYRLYIPTAHGCR